VLTTGVCGCADRPLNLGGTRNYDLPALVYSYFIDPFQVGPVLVLGLVVLGSFPIMIALSTGMCRPPPVSGAEPSFPGGPVFPDDPRLGSAFLPGF
jgi:hypothetical protein